MKTVTLKQTKKVLVELLDILEDVPSDQLQKLFASGLLTDLLKADAEQVNRNGFQRMIFLIFHFVHKFDCDHQKDGFVLREDSTDGEGDFTPELVDIFKKDEQSISGEELMNRAEKQKSWCGQRHLEAMLREKDKIPVVYREKSLLFPGTSWIYKQDGSMWYPSLFWSDQWYCTLRGLRVSASDADSIKRKNNWLVRPRK